MRLRNILIVVKDIERSKKFYHDLFGLDIVLDNDGNIILTEGLVLQDEKIWKDFLGKTIIPESNSCELYFEEQNIERFVEKLERLYPDIQYVNRLMTHSWGQKVVRQSLASTEVAIPQNSARSTGKAKPRSFGRMLPSVKSFVFFISFPPEIPCYTKKPDKIPNDPSASYPAL